MMYSIPQKPELFIEGELRSKALAILGGKRDDYSFGFDDFDKWSYASGTGIHSPVGLWDVLLNPSSYGWRASLDSYLALSPGQHVQRQFVIEGGPLWGPLNGRRWMLSMRLKNQTYLANGCVGMEIATGNYGVNRAGIWMFGHISGRICYGHGDATWTGGALVDPSGWAVGNVGTIPMGAEEGAGLPHIMTLLSLGDGTYRASLDDGLLCSPVSYNPSEITSPTEGAGVRINFGAGLGQAHVDWLFYAVHR